MARTYKNPHDAFKVSRSSAFNFEEPLYEAFTGADVTGGGSQHSNYDDHGSFITNHYLITPDGWPAAYTAGESVKDREPNYRAVSAAMGAAMNTLYTLNKETKKYENGFSTHGNSTLGNLFIKLEKLYAEEFEAETKYITKIKASIEEQLNNSLVKNPRNSVRAREWKTTLEIMRAAIESGQNKRDYTEFWGLVWKYKKNKSVEDVSDFELGHYLNTERNSARAVDFFKDNKFWNARKATEQAIFQILRELVELNIEDSTIKLRNSDLSNFTVADIAGRIMSNFFSNDLIRIDPSTGKLILHDDNPDNPKIHTTLKGINSIYENITTQLLSYFTETFKGIKDKDAQKAAGLTIGTPIKDIFNTDILNNAMATYKADHSNAHTTVKSQSKSANGGDKVMTYLIRSLSMTGVKDVLKGIAPEMAASTTLAKASGFRNSLALQVGSAKKEFINAATGEKYSRNQLTDSAVFNYEIDVKGFWNEAMSISQKNKYFDFEVAMLQAAETKFNSVQNETTQNKHASLQEILNDMTLVEINSKNWAKGSPTVMSERSISKGFAGLNSLFTEVNNRMWYGTRIRNSRGSDNLGRRRSYEYIYDKLLFLLVNTAEPGMFSHETRVNQIANMIGYIAVGASWDDIFANWDTDFQEGLQGFKFNKFHVFQWNGLYISASTILKDVLESLNKGDNTGNQVGAYQVNIAPWDGGGCISAYHEIIKKTELEPDDPKENQKKLAIRWNRMRNLAMENSLIEIRLRQGYANRIQEDINALLTAAGY